MALAAMGGLVLVTPAHASTPFRPAAKYPVLLNGAGDSAGAMVTADFNGDGKPDLAVADLFGLAVEVMLNRGDGTFRPPIRVTVPGSPYALAAADLSGRIDLLVATEVPSQLVVLRGHGDGNFSVSAIYPTGPFPQYVAVGDFNGDGHIDAAVANIDGTVDVLLGRGNGRFRSAPRISGLGSNIAITAADFDRDGRADLAVAQGGGTVKVLLSHGDGTFAPPRTYTVGGVPEDIRAGDLTGDGSIDLAVPRGGGGVAVLHGSVDGSFAPAAIVSTPTGNGVQIADFDGDGRPDLAVADCIDSKEVILSENADGRFTPAGSYPVTICPQSAATGDFNGDGRPDLATAASLGPYVSVLMNDTK